MIEIKKILCPTDLTPESSEALRYAVALAREYGAKLYLCHSSSEAAAAVAGGRGSIVAGRGMQSVFEEALVPHLGMTDFSQLDWEGFVADGDDAGVVIVEEAAARGCNLIVMRSRRRPRMAALLGSEAETVCRTAPCSVLVTHPHEREWVGYSAGDVDLRRVLVAHDFSDRSELALQYGQSLARRFGPELHVLHVLPAPEGDGPEVAWMPGAAHGLCHAAAERLRVAVPPGSYAGEVKCAVLTGRPYDRVLAYAKEHEIDLVCMGADGVDRGARALFGSNVDRVLRQAPCPVLIARPYAPRVR
jgi:nucleotide-binding universal stress UspA family protein